MVEDSRQFAYVFEQSGETPEELGKNFHMHARFYVKGKATDVSKGKVAKEVVRITKWPKNSTHVVLHDNVHKLTSYMAGNKNFAEHPSKKAKCDMDVIWRHQNHLHKEYFLRNSRIATQCDVILSLFYTCLTRCTSLKYGVSKQFVFVNLS